MHGRALLGILDTSYEQKVILLYLAWRRLCMHALITTFNSHLAFTCLPEELTGVAKGFLSRLKGPW